MGNTALSWQELKSFISLSELHVEYQEVLIMREASTSYVLHLQKGKKENCPYPYGSDDETPRDDIKAKMQQIKQGRQGKK